MLWIIISWILSLFYVLPWGGFFFKLFSLQPTSEENKYSLDFIFLGGLIFLCCMLNILSLFSGFSIYTYIPFTLFSVHFFYKNMREISYFSFLKDLSKKDFYLILVGIIVMIIRTADTNIVPDSGYYHEQSILWIQKFGLILGLGNIHYPLSVNSSYFTLAAYHRFLLTHDNLLGLICVLWMFRVFYETKRKNVFALISFLLYMIAFKRTISSASPDLPNGIFLWYVFYLVNYAKDYTLKFRGVLAFLFSTFAISIKLLSVPILLVPLYFIFKHKMWKEFIPVVCWGLLLNIPWFIRNICISGYLIYPFYKIDLFSVDWKIPAKMVELESDYIKAWSRIWMTPKEKLKEVLAMSVVEWFPYWLKSYSFYYKPVMLLSIILVPINLLRWKNKMSMIGILVICLLFWFFNAPDIRYGAFYIFIFFSYLVADFKLMSKERFFKGCQFILVIVMISRLNPRLHQLVYSYSYGHPRELVKFSSTYVYIDSVKFNIPLNHPRENCYIIELPCFPPHRVNTIELRGKTIKDGVKHKK